MFHPPHESARRPAAIAARAAALILVFAAAATTPLRARAASVDIGSDFVVADGLEVTLWSESPQLFKPTNLDVDSRGRIWVAEGVNYRTFRGQDANQPETIHFRRPDGDRILILEDTRGGGAADSSKVFVQDRDLVAPLGVAVVGNRVFVSCSPHLIVYTLDETGDHPAKKEIFLTGFGGRDHDHGLHSVVAGPDGRLYFNAGNAGPHIVRDRGGRTLRAGSVYTGGSPYNTNNTPNLRSDDGRVWTGGLAMRVEPDGRGLIAIAHNFRNSYEVAIDSFGDLWQSDNDDEVRACRTSWLMAGANMGFFSADGTRTWRADQRPGQSIQTAQWHQDDPGVLPAGDVYGAGGPTGVAVYEGGLLPREFRGAVLDCDAGRNTVFVHRPVPDGAGFRLERSILLTSRRTSTEGYRWDDVSLADRSTWFRPSDVVVGTDGAVYVSDWYDPVVGGHAMRSTNGYGRILRIAPKGANPHPPRLDLHTPEGQVAALSNPAVNVRFAAREKLAAEPAAAKALLERTSRDPNPDVRARVAWLPGFAVAAFSDAEPRVRVAAFRALRREIGDRPAAWSETLRRAASDASPMLRREAAIALRDASLGESQELLLDLAARYAGGDRVALEAIGLGCSGKEEALYSLLLARLGGAGDPLAWSQALADLVWRLHPAACVPAATKRAGAAGLSPEARRLAVETIAFVASQGAADAMLALAAGGPNDVRAAALWWARFRAANEWKAWDVAARLPDDQASAAARALQAKVQALRSTLLNPAAGPGEQADAVRTLAGSEAGGFALIKLAADGRLPAACVTPAGEALLRNPSLAVRAMATQYFPRPSRTGEPFPAMAELVSRRGDAARGAKVFAGETAGCLQCHSFDGRGGTFGPDLTTVRSKLGREGIFDSVLNPSAVIAAGYEPWILETKDGETHSGFVVSEAESLGLKEPSGAIRSIPVKEIVSRQKQAYSFMPDNVSAGLTPQELVDLVEYLQSAPLSRTP